MTNDDKSLISAMRYACEGKDLLISKFAHENVELIYTLKTILDVWDEHKIIGPMVYHDARAIIEKAERGKT